MSWCTTFWWRLELWSLFSILNLFQRCRIMEWIRNTFLKIRDGSPTITSSWSHFCKWRETGESFKFFLSMMLCHKYIFLNWKPILFIILCLYRNFIAVPEANLRFFMFYKLLILWLLLLIFNSLPNLSDLGSCWNCQRQTGYNF